MNDPHLRLLLVHTVLWSHYKAAVFCSTHKLALEQNVEFKVIQIARNEFKRREFDVIDYDAHRYPYELLFDDYLESIPILRRIERVIRAIGKFQPDVLIIPGYSDPVCWAAIAYGKWKGIRIASTMGSTEQDRPRSAYKEKIKSWLLSFIDGVFCYGTPQRKYLQKLGVPKDKIITRRQATDNQKIRELFLKEKNGPKEKDHFPEKNFVYAGRLAPEKNLFTLLDAFKATRSDWGLILVGGGPLEIELQQYCRDHQIENVFFEGPKKWFEVFAYLAHSSVFVLPSTRDPWGVVVNEAMLCELPVLVSDRCGCAPDLVDEGINGYTFSPNDVKALSGHMQNFIDGEYNLEAMGGNSFEIIKTYTPEHAAGQLLEGVWKVSRETMSTAQIAENF